MDYVPYRAYLIRVWPTRREGAVDCRVSVHNVSTGESETFASLDGLLAFLETQRVAWENPGGIEYVPDERPRTAGNRDESGLMMQDGMKGNGT